MTVHINSLNTTARRCYNDEAVEAALKRIVSKRTSAQQPVPQDDLIRELGRLPGRRTRSGSVDR